MKRAALLCAFCGCAVWLAGCATVPRRDATAELIARPDFQQAAQAAPKWVGAALQEITQLEAELAARK